MALMMEKAINEIDKTAYAIVAKKGLKNSCSSSSCKILKNLLELIVFSFQQVCIHEISRSPSSFLPAEKSGYRRTDGPTDRRTDGRTDTPSYRVVAHD